VYEQILTEVSDNILTITLNRPDKMNAYTLKMGDELIDAFTKANQNDDVRCIIVTGAGECFCAGADLSGGIKSFDIKELANIKNQDIEWSQPQFRDPGGLISLSIFNSLKPVIGATNGPAIGIGSTMQLPMDFRVASESSRFGFVFAQRGVVPEACSSWFLPKIVGISKALDWTLTGRIFDAEEALKAGLISSIHKPDNLLSDARELAGQIIQKTSQISIALIRQMMWRSLGSDHPMEAHKIESRAFLSMGMSDEAKEGVMSFLEKRPAHFPGKVSKDMPAIFPWWKDKPYS
jgi:enoyl-CoA hydratase/carnithine racemase